MSTFDGWRPTKQYKTQFGDPYTAIYYYNKDFGDPKVSVPKQKVGLDPPVEKQCDFNENSNVIVINSVICKKIYDASDVTEILA